MKNIKKGLILLGLALTVSSCYYDDIQDVPVIPTEVSFTLDIQPILNNNCIACHDGTIVAEPDLRDGNSFSALMSLPAGSIIPGDAAGSELMEMLNHNPANPNPMPPGAPMANRNITLFGNWIDQGAKNN